MLQIPGMTRRVITPYSGFPDYETLEELERNYLGCNGPAMTGTMLSLRKGKSSRRRRTHSSAVPGNFFSFLDCNSESIPN